MALMSASDLDRSLLCGRGAASATHDHATNATIESAVDGWTFMANRACGVIRVTTGAVYQPMGIIPDFALRSVRSHVTWRKIRARSESGGWQEIAAGMNQIKKASVQLNHSVPEALMRVAETHRSRREASPRIAADAA
jgi:hypothetical protein